MNVFVCVFSWYFLFVCLWLFACFLFCFFLFFFVEVSHATFSLNIYTFFKLNVRAIVVAEKLVKLKVVAAARVLVVLLVVVEIVVVVEVAVVAAVVAVVVSVIFKFIGES